MQHDYEQNRESNMGRRERRGDNQSNRDEERQFGGGEQADPNFGRQGQDIGARGPRSGADDDMFLERERSGGQGRRERGDARGEQGSRWEGRERQRDFGGSSPYGEEQEWVRARGENPNRFGQESSRADYSSVRRDRDYPYRGNDYRDYGYAGGGGGGRAGYGYEGSAAYEGRGYGSDYDFEGRGGYEDRGYGSDVYEGGRGHGAGAGAGGYGGRGPYESRDWGGRWHEGPSGDWSRRGGSPGVLDYEEQRRRGGAQGYGAGGRVRSEPRSWTRERSFRGTGPKGYSRSDESILDDVCQRLQDAEDIDPSEVTVTVDGGEVKLTGTVEGRWAKRYAEDIAYEIRGVKDVHNELRVQSGQAQGAERAQGAEAEEGEEGRRRATRGNGAEQQTSLSS